MHRGGEKGSAHEAEDAVYNFEDGQRLRPDEKGVGSFLEDGMEGIISQGGGNEACGIDHADGPGEEIGCVVEEEVPSGQA